MLWGFGGDYLGGNVQACGRNVLSRGSIPSGHTLQLDIGNYIVPYYHPLVLLLQFSGLSALLEN